jgi:16S rRNA processing protein RimM
MNIDFCYKIGLVMKPHGLKGEVTISLDDISTDFSNLESIFIEEKENRLVPLFISSASLKGEKAFVKFEDVDTIEEALKISKKALYLPKSTRPKSGKGEFYDDEIQGFEVTDEISGPLGKVTDVIQTGANRLLEVDYNGKEILIPINSPLIISINKSKRTISVNLPDGFLEI